MLAKRKATFLTDMNDRLNQMPDSEDKQDLIKKRDHCMAKFPIFPTDLSIWTVAYFEDWFREYARVTEQSS
jgi:hypothetical protein